MDKTKKLVLLAIIVVALAVAWFAFIAPNMYPANPDAGKTGTTTTTITLPNGTVQQITGTSGFPVSGSSGERPPTPPA